MGTLGAVHILTDTLLAASERGLLLPHGQELGGLLARLAGAPDEDELDSRQSTERM